MYLDFKPVRFTCPNCTSALWLDKHPGPRPVLHHCPKLGGFLAPMFREGEKVKVEAHEREDYLGEDEGKVRLNEDGRPFMCVETTRENGTDVLVFAPIATGEGR